LDFILSFFPFFSKPIAEDLLLDDVVDRKCPHCKDPILRSGYYESRLDDSILKRVEDTCDIDPVTTLDCSERKERYHQRRNKYLEKKKKERDAFRKGQVVKEDVKDFDEDEEVTRKWISYFVVLLLFTVAACRSRV